MVSIAYNKMLLTFWATRVMLVGVSNVIGWGQGF